MRIILLTVCSLSLVACERATSPPPVAQQQQTPRSSRELVQTDDLHMVSGTPFPGSSDPRLDEPSPSPAAAMPADETPRAPVFQNPQAAQALEQYATEVQKVKQFQGPSADADPIKNPQAFTSGLNELGAHLDALKNAREQVESNLRPDEKTRWHEYRKALEHPQ